MYWTYIKNVLLLRLLNYLPVSVIDHIKSTTSFSGYSMDVLSELFNVLQFAMYVLREQNRYDNMAGKQGNWLNT